MSDDSLEESIAAHPAGGSDEAPDMEGMARAVIDQLISNVPSQPTPTNYWIEIVEVDNGERAIIMSFLTPTGVFKIWWGVEATMRFATELIENVKVARKPRIETAKTIGQAVPQASQEEMTRIARDIMQGHVARGGPKQHG